ncbi:hypothetical protein [Pedobacter heparinus]|uniref:Uncharacterized protein n=1 Tax=Pedobacter heparinus (strain ATCC 13125 / DSM 2366 / CIP 104194 / JCM 7457 / NBRC 12017 / NCIMB 9290 / NRRL B-14731 / HIM 762-3) TaxID=485917 RepID=C6Y3M4_PEDHD|nr:hypothetical protein [Pedobacter heparinus]ACU03303.1 hypothetical protein Phep_1085 [Pedobacter heparinus DSM 2366]
MKPKKKNKEKTVEVPEKVLLSLVAAKLRGRDLFPELTKRAKEFMEKADFSGVL